MKFETNVRALQNVAVISSSQVTPLLVSTTRASVAIATWEIEPQSESRLSRLAPI